MLVFDQLWVAQCTCIYDWFACDSVPWSTADDNDYDDVDEYDQDDEYTDCGDYDAHDEMMMAESLVGYRVVIRPSLQIALLSQI